MAPRMPCATRWPRWPSAAAPSSTSAASARSTRDRGVARTHDGDEVGFDHLLVACGSRLLAGVPGAVTFWGVADDGNVLDVVQDLREGG